MRNGTTDGFKDDATRAPLLFGLLLLAVSLPLGMTLEALHALKVPVYLGSHLRRELWTLAHAHGNLLALLCLTYAALAPSWIDAEPRRRIGRLLCIGAAAMPLGFFLGGVLNTEGDPSLGILLVPAGGVCLLAALVLAFLAARR
jgi:hypothetical protein